SVDTLYDADGTWSAGELIDMLDSDTYGLINHLGHADTDYVMKLDNDDVDELTNEELFFVYSQGCYPGNFVSDSIAEHFTTSTRHGAVAVVFNSRYGWGYYNDSHATLDSASQRLNRQFWDALFGEGINRLGAMNADSHEDNIWGVNDVAVRWVIYETNLFGDPAVAVGSVEVEGVDLRGTEFDVTPDSLGVSGGTAAASFTVNNRGASGAGSFNVRFYLSEDEVIDPAADTPLAIDPADPSYNPSDPAAYTVGALAAGADHRAGVSLTVPEADPFATGGQYTIGMFVDADLDVAEAREDNNRNTGLYRDYDDVYYDSAGAAVNSHSPAGAVVGAQNAVRFRFDEPMDPASFTRAGDVVSFTGPAGDLIGEITGHAWVNPQTLDVQFNAQGALGTYTMVIGPDIADESGNPMNQDGDATNGEAVQDRYAASFTIVNAIYVAGMDGDPGWTLDGGWAWGTPVGGGSHAGDPSCGHTGDRVVGYNLLGDYGDGIYPAEYATTPAIDCSGFEDITLGFYRWLGVESAEYDRASVQVSGDGVSWVTVWRNPMADVSDSGWLYQEFDISPVADGQPAVRVRWGMGPTDGWVTFPGWNIDDVMVIGIPDVHDTRGPAVVGQDPAGLVGGAQSAVTFTFDDVMDRAGFAVADDVVSFTGPGGDLVGAITGFTWTDDRTLEVRFAAQSAIGGYAMVIGPNVPDDVGNPMNQDGDATNGEAVEDRYTAAFEIVDVIYVADMESDPGWTLDAAAGGSNGWQWGVPTGGGSHDGDPAAGHTGDGVIGYNLSGDYGDDLHAVEYATTPAIDCSSFENVTLSFHRWLGVESSYYDHAEVQVSDDGEIWQDVWVHTERNISDAEWVYQEFDISSVADEQAGVYVRWGMGPTDWSVTYPGWNLDDVTLTGTPAGPDVRGPAVRRHEPSGPVTGSLAAVAFVFDDVMDTSSFAVADDVVSFTGPAGDLLGEITGHTWTNNRTLEVQFHAQAVAGAYRMVIGPNITDDTHNAMNQDGDAINGEAVEDRYAATIEVVEVLYFANMDVNPGWAFDPGSGANRWRWGAPVGGGTEPGDPTSAYTGRYVIGYD
ncbi:MAG: C25 family cysteine peptidase, partial [Phycisphaerae bacterium]